MQKPAREFDQFFYRPGTPCDCVRQFRQQIPRQPLQCLSRCHAAQPELRRFLLFEENECPRPAPSYTVQSQAGFWFKPENWNSLLRLSWLLIPQRLKPGGSFVPQFQPRRQPPRHNPALFS
jgi:hypothetical protein